jgi:murein DD-endopeptidase MepM/ murein hydrolase activator NlpD
MPIARRGAVAVAATGLAPVLAAALVTIAPAASGWLGPVSAGDDAAAMRRGPAPRLDRGELGIAALTAPTPAEPVPGPAFGTYAWPVRGPVLRGFDPPDTPYGSGHRGIDIGTGLGTTVVAAQDGVVAFAGPVAGSLFVSIDHPDGVRTTYSWLSEVGVRSGDVVRKGDPIGRSGAGHPGTSSPHLHLGARIGSTYIDPLLLLERGSVVGLIHLAPLEQAG